MTNLLIPIENDKINPLSSILNRTIDIFCDWLSNPRACNLSPAGSNREKFLNLLKIIMLNPDTEGAHLRKIFKALDRDTAILDETLTKIKKVTRATKILFDFLAEDACEYNQVRCLSRNVIQCINRLKNV